MSTRHNSLPSRIRGWFISLTRIQKLLATIAALVITIGAVASAITATLDLADRLRADTTKQPEDNAYLGVQVRDVVLDIAEGGAPSASASASRSDRETTLIIPDHGVRVTAVDRNSPAARAGVKRGDVITTINGTMVRDVDSLKSILNNAEPGDYLRLSLVRGWPVGAPFSPRLRPVPNTHRESIRVRLEPM